MARTGSTRRGTYNPDVMPSIGHLAVGLAAGRVARAPGRARQAVWLAALVAVSFASDLDVVAFRLGIPYGAPFGHRFNAGLFRTVHFMFTPYTLYQDEDLDELFHVVLDFLYDPSITAPVSSIRYEDSKFKTSVSEARKRYWQRCDEQTLEDGKEISAEALRNLRR